MCVCVYTLARTGGCTHRGQTEKAGLPGAEITDVWELFGVGARGTKLGPSGKTVSALNHGLAHLSSPQGISQGSVE